jgi:hypothetical protein
MNERALEKTENSTKNEQYKDTGSIGNYIDQRKTKQKTKHRKQTRCATRAPQKHVG